MNKDMIKKLLEELVQGDCTLDQALDRLLNKGYEDLGFAHVDLDRNRRCGFPEVVFCTGKKPKQAAEICKTIFERDRKFLATRADTETFEQVKQAVPSARYNEQARTITAEEHELEKKGTVHIVTGGTSDIPVAEEAAETALIMGRNVTKLYDVGVAGIHRLLNNTDLFKDAKVVIAAAGMEGALPSVVGGLVDCPVIAVPTSIGYGASFGGVAALLSMLNSCASNVLVTNIDNGFRAGYVASLIANPGKNTQLE
jgi:NCAIR mutase (PurE)-related protein